MIKPFSFVVLLIAAASGASLFSQNPVPPQRIESVQLFEQGDKPSMLDSLKFENIGPTVFSGRVVDLAIDPSDPTHFYVAYASGGLWETVNNGTSFNPIFDHEAVMTIGAIAVDWQNDVLWVGTGEVNSSRSSYAGVGMYKSTDGGTSWNYMGLPESHHIGKILIHPQRRDEVLVGVLGHLYSDNPERGVYKTTDGGASWTKTLFVDESTGVVDMLADPENPDVLYAAAWQRLRKAWNFIEAGPGSGIYKSTDFGMTWSLMTTEGSGFPTGEGVGRIGLAIHSASGQHRLYALLDNYYRQDPKGDETKDLTKDDFKRMSATDLAELEDKDLEKYLRSNRFPRKYRAKEVKKMVADGEILPADLAHYLEDANSLLFDTPVIGAELYQSTDGGKSWVKTHDQPLDGVYFSYGYYFGVIAVDPSNADQVYIAGVPILASSDGGRSFKSINGENVHVDHHKIWVNPDRPGHLIIGNDGGVNISYDNGETWIKCNSPSVGQFYYINVDHQTPYNVYGGTQDNGVWMGSNRYPTGTRWHNTGRYPYNGILGGDGMQVQIDSRDNLTVYTGFQFGNYFRINTQTGERKRITPTHDLGQRPYRWNWQSPIHLSRHHQDIIYFGAQILFRSLDQGDHFEAISDDLTKGGKEGDVPYGTLTTIHESPLQFGLLYTGSDDGLIHISKDGGQEWTNISSGLPNDLWVARLQASAHHKARVYAALNGYRNDDFAPYLYMSDDYGQNWTNIASALPDEPINVIKEDPVNENVIYVGTDRGSYVSLDGGNTYTRLRNGLTSAPVHDLVVHPEAKDLLIGTHGRSIFKGHVGRVQELAAQEERVFTFFAPTSVNYRSNVGNRRAFYLDYSANTVELDVFAPHPGQAEMRVIFGDGIVVSEDQIQVAHGLSTISYDLAIDEDAVETYKKSLPEDSDGVKKADDGKTYLLPGTYTIEIVWDGQTHSHKLEITD